MNGLDLFLKRINYCQVQGVFWCSNSEDFRLNLLWVIKKVNPLRLHWRKMIIEISLKIIYTGQITCCSDWNDRLNGTYPAWFQIEELNSKAAVEQREMEQKHTLVQQRVSLQLTHLLVIKYVDHTRNGYGCDVFSMIRVEPEVSLGAWFLGQIDKSSFIHSFYLVIIHAYLHTVMDV